MSLVDVPAAPRECRNLVGGACDLTSPYTGTVVGRVGLSDVTDVAAAVDAARAAFPAWRALPIKERSQPLFRFRALLLEHLDALANLAALEAGKTRAEARAG